MNIGSTPNDDLEYEDVGATAVFSNCCCCICQCSDSVTKDEVCCFFVPLKAGVVFIAILTVVLIAWQISQQFFLMLNDQVKWWYPFVNVILYIPTYTGAAIFVSWIGKDDVANRGGLFCSCILVVISTALVAAWAIIYFVWIYKQEFVYYGWGTPESGYLKFQKKYYLFRELLWAIIIICAYSYFICVTMRYRDLLRQKRQDPEAHKLRLKQEEFCNKRLDNPVAEKGDDDEESKPLLRPSVQKQLHEFANEKKK